jgi:hypothetical protein
MPARARSARIARETCSIFCCLICWTNSIISGRGAAAKRLFAERATHAFPPSAALPSEWRRELEALAQEVGYRTAKAEEIEEEFAAVFHQSDSAWSQYIISPESVGEYITNVYHAVMDEGRKRVLAIVAGILVARHLKNPEDLDDSRPSPEN